MSGAYRQLAVAVSIGEPHTYGVAADAGAGVHPQCLVAECCSLGGRRSRRPGADPMQIIRHISSSSDGRAGYRTTTSMSQPDHHDTAQNDPGICSSLDRQMEEQKIAVD